MIYYLPGVTVGVSPTLERYFGEGNLANYTNAEAEEILKELHNITDEKTLKEKYEKLRQIYEDDRAYIGLYFSTITSVYGKGLTATAKNNWFNIFYDIENWHRRS